MLHLLCNRNNHYRRPFLCFIVICILFVCAANGSPERLSYIGVDNASSIEAPEAELSDIATNEIAGFPVIKSAALNSIAADRFFGFRMALIYALLNYLFLLIGTSVPFFLYFYRTVVTSHLFIITYIHNLDGMKP